MKGHSPLPAFAHPQSLHTPGRDAVLRECDIRTRMRSLPLSRDLYLTTFVRKRSSEVRKG